MCPSPYRIAEDPPVDSEPAAPSPDAELLPVFVILWLCSLLRVGFGLETGEVFGAELTLAAMLTLALPLCMKDTVGSLLRNRRAPSAALGQSPHAAPRDP